MSSERIHVLKKIRKAFQEVREDLYAMYDHDTAALIPGIYTDETMPEEAPEGGILFDQNRETLAWNTDAGFGRPTYTQHVLLVPEEVSNTAERTTVWDPGLRADSMVQGRAYRLELHGTFETAAAEDEFSIGVDVGGAEVASFTSTGEGSPWKVEMTMTVRADGQSGAVKANSLAAFDGSPSTASTQPVTIDTTAPEYLTVSIEWNNAKSGNVATLQQAHLTQMA